MTSPARGSFWLVATSLSIAAANHSSMFMHGLPIVLCDSERQCHGLSGMNIKRNRSKAPRKADPREEVTRFFVQTGTDTCVDLKVVADEVGKAAI